MTAVVVGVRTCSINGCERKHDARGWCSTHYSRWRQGGDPTRIWQPITLAEKFWEAIRNYDPDECWPWVGAPDVHGYGTFCLPRNGGKSYPGDWQKAKTHCPQNHAYNEANTGHRRDGSRYCRMCARDRMRLNSRKAKT